MDAPVATAAKTAAFPVSSAAAKTTQGEKVRYARPSFTIFSAVDPNGGN